MADEDTPPDVWQIGKRFPDPTKPVPLDPLNPLNQLLEMPQGTALPQTAGMAGTLPGTTVTVKSAPSEMPTVQQALAQLGAYDPANTDAGPVRLPAATPAGTTLGPTPQVSTDILSNRIATLTARQQRLEDERLAREEKIGAQRETQMGLAEQAVREANNRELATIEAEKERNKELPRWQPAPIFNPEDVQLLGIQLIAMALAGGLRGSEGWQRAASAMDGAISGYVQGSREKMEMQWQNYQAEYKRALDMQHQQQKEFEDTLRAEELSLNQKLREIGNLSSRWQREDIAYETRTSHDLGRIESQITALTMGIPKVEEANARFQIQMDSARAHMASSNANFGLSEEAVQVLQQVDFLTGRPGQYTHYLYSRYAAPIADRIFNNMVVTQMEEHPDWVKPNGQPDTKRLAQALIENGMVIQANQQAENINKKRESAVERLTESITGIERIIDPLVQRVIPTNTPYLNVPINEFIRRFAPEGDTANELQALDALMKTASRQYMEAVTMPGSQAQMHVGSQEVADAMLNTNLTVGQIQYTFKAWNAEITITHGALSAISKRLIEAVMHANEEDVRKRGADDWSRGWDTPSGNALMPNIQRAREESDDVPPTRPQTGDMQHDSGNVLDWADTPTGVR